MADKQLICKQALMNLGITVPLANVESDTTKEAIVCRAWYDSSVEFALEDFDWDFARRRLPLALVTGLAVPVTNWAYVYGYPGDAAALRGIEITGVRTPYAELRIPFAIGGESSPNGDFKVIYTDQAAAIAVYTKRLTDATLFDSHFALALGWLLASNIAMPLTVKAGLAEMALAQYQRLRLNAYAYHLNQGQEDPEPETESLRARNG